MGNKFSVIAPDHGEEKWGDRSVVHAGCPRKAAEEYVEGTEASCGEYDVASGRESLVVHVKDETSGREYRFSVSGEMAPHYCARPLGPDERKVIVAPKRSAPLEGCTWLSMSVLQTEPHDDWIVTIELRTNGLVSCTHARPCDVEYAIAVWRAEGRLEG